MSNSEISPTETEQASFWTLLAANEGLAQYLQVVFEGSQPAMPPDVPSQIHFKNISGRINRLSHTRRQVAAELVRSFCETDYTDDDFAKADFVIAS